MAIDRSFARFLIRCHRDGVKFDRTLTLGRLNYYLSVQETKQLLRWARIDPARCGKLLDYESSRYSEAFFETLGAREVDSLDASSFEGATIVHDLNLPVPDALKGQFDCVCDAGTIEHVMNFPVVIRNAMELTKVGGHLILGTPANNFCGHGFYQFSPELWFRLFSAGQGFELRRLVAVEYAPRVRWFEVADPASIRSRVEIMNRYPVLLLVLARKVAAVPVLETFPQQSDYQPRWEGQKHSSQQRSPMEVLLRRKFLETFPRLARFLEHMFLYTGLNRRVSLRNRRAFKRVKE